MLAWVALSGCEKIVVPGHLPRPGSVQVAFQAEPLRCGTLTERPVAKSAPEAPIFGAADYHNHQFSNLGFGKRIVWGSTYAEGGMPEALSACGTNSACNFKRVWCREIDCRFRGNPKACRAQCDQTNCEDEPPHGPRGAMDPIGALLGQGIGHDVGGYPRFIGWPNWNSYTHQQEYHRWLRRAFDGGLKLIVMHAVTNRALCKYVGGGADCSDMYNANRQLNAAKKLEKDIDREDDCIVNGSGWYRIATTPAKAREIIHDGAMAVVLGLEVDSLFNCSESGVCEPGEVLNQIKTYKKFGVSHIYPIHVFDNKFGAAAAYNDIFNVGSIEVNGHSMCLRDCSNDGYDFKFGWSTELHDLAADLAKSFGYDLPRYDNDEAQCNVFGLSATGKDMIQWLMNAKIIIDIDHMSTRARAETLAIAEACKYPGLVSSHSGFTEIYHGDKKHEGQLTKDETDRLLALGGLVAPLLREGGRKELPGGKFPWAPRLKEIECGNSAESFAHAYLYAVDRTKEAVSALKQKPGNENRVIGVGFGSDINGLAGMPTPRFGFFACGGDKSEVTTPRVRYPIGLERGLGEPMEESQAGSRAFDINEDGFAHIGMFPDFVAELRSVGLTETDLRPLFNAAEAYIEMWEATEHATVVCDPTALERVRQSPTPEPCLRPIDD